MITNIPTTPERFANEIKQIIYEAGRSKETLSGIVKAISMYKTTEVSKRELARVKMISALKDMYHYAIAFNTLASEVGAYLAELATYRKVTPGIKRFAMKDGDFVEVTLEEAAQLEGLTVQEYLAKEAEESVDDYEE